MLCLKLASFIRTCMLHDIKMLGNYFTLDYLKVMVVHEIHKWQTTTTTKVGEPMPFTSGIITMSKKLYFRE